MRDRTKHRSTDPEHFGREDAREIFFIQQSSRAQLTELARRRHPRQDRLAALIHPLRPGIDRRSRRHG